MKFIFLILLSVTQVMAHERIVKTKADNMAFGKFHKQKSHQWPFPLLSIGHNMQSFQDYSGSPYWHDGLDIRSVPDQPIYAAAGGKVVNVENYIHGNHLYWEVAIQDEEGFVWKYHHVAKDSITQEIHRALNTNEKIAAGTLIGNVVKWPVSSYGEVYHHLHLLVVGVDGYINPFLMMEPLTDTVAPVISRIGLAKDHKPIDGAEVKGEHAIFLEASDLVMHKKFILPPHKISYRLNHGEEKVVWNFVNLPSGKNDTDFISDFFMKGTCGNYNCRKFYFNLNFSKEKPRGLFSLPAGNHEIEVSVEDMVGNKATKSFKWKVL
ncbi:MAG: M23 family metallopeptidase [Bdellovibrionales bacterium]|nr:M23 family metallopeptidase [Bdellovibrionales bacterium]